MKSFFSKGLLIALAALLVLPAAYASDPVGRVNVGVTDDSGAVLPGVQVVVSSPATGLERTAFTNSDGEVRFVQLPVGEYDVQAQLEGFQTWESTTRVVLGQTSNVSAQMAVGAVEDVLEVVDTVPLLDTTSTTSGLTVSTSELTERVPIVREATAVALLAPATTEGDRAFDGSTPGQSLTAVGGSSVAENTYIVNGLNITNFRNGLGANNVPFEMVQEIQVKTGGFPAEFGWATGGVVNVVTKSGTNEFHGGVNAFHEPEDLAEQSPDTPGGAINSEEERTVTSANVFLGGPIYRDRAFFFGLYEYRDRENDGISGGQKTTFQQDDPFYGGKLDLNVTSNHRLEFTYFEDSTDVIGDASDFASGSFVGESFDARGGENYTGRYTGIFGDSFVLAAQYGVNEFARTSQGSTDANPAIIDSRQGGLVFLGNWANFTVTGADDQRDMYRLDADYFLTEHSLRAGGSRDENFSFNEQTYTGGIYWRYFIGDGGFGEVPGSELVRERVFENGGSFDTINEAYYVQDNWEVNERLQINAGLRLESYDNQNANGESFIEVENQYGPRVGAIYDPSGDGRSKIYGNYGRYFLPIAANTNIRLAGAEFFTEDWYLLNGLNADDTPIIGDLLESRVFSNGTIPDVRETTSEEIDPFFQDEFVIGYERLVSDNWSVGVRGVYRDVGDIIEDITINQAVATQLGVTTDDLAGVGLGNHYVLVNPGESIVTFWDVTDASGALGPDGTPDRFELSEAELGYPDPERQYYAAEFTFNRRFAGNWSLQGSYTWAHSYGNYEGWVRSDNGQDDAGITTLYDFPGLLDGANGNLPNDRRHNVKLFGAYRFDMGLLVGLNTSFRSGRPLNSFGVHPTDEGAASYGAESFFTDGVLTPRGSGGETDDVFRMDLTARYDFDIGPTDLSLRFDVFNVFDDDTAIELVETAEEESGAPDPLFLTPTQFVRPRTVRLGFELTF